MKIDDVQGRNEELGILLKKLDIFDKDLHANALQERNP
jgi:hypothetical protein